MEMNVLAAAQPPALRWRLTPIETSRRNQNSVGNGLEIDRGSKADVAVGRRKP